METWLKQSGAVGLDALEVADFPVTGRGVRARRRLKHGDSILTIPAGSLWTVKHAYADSLLGPALRSVQPSLSVEDTLAVYLLFVRSRDSGYEGPRSHVAAMPASYLSSIFFTDDELQVCAGTSLYTRTTLLKQRVEDDYRQLLVRLLAQHPGLFPLDKFTVEDVCADTSMMDFWNQALTCSLLFPLVQMGPLHSLESWDGFHTLRGKLDPAFGPVRRHAEPLVRR